MCSLVLETYGQIANSSNLASISICTCSFQAFEYYFEQLRNVLDSFNCTYADLGIPDSFSEFESLLKKCLVLEFLIVTVIKPILGVENHRKLLVWHKVRSLYRVVHLVG